MKRILLVEDDVILRHVLSGQLNANGFEVSEAQNGEEALEILKIEKPDVILLDLILPGTDGFEVLKKVKTDPTTEGIYVMVLSNLGDDDAIKRAFNLGADDYFVKAQYPIKNIIEKLNSFLKNGNGKNGAASPRSEAPEKETAPKEAEGKNEEVKKETKEKKEKNPPAGGKKESAKAKGRHLQID